MSGNVKWLWGSFVLVVLIFYIPGLVSYPFFKDAFHNYYNFQGAPYLAFFTVFPLYAVMLFFWLLFFVSSPGVNVPKLSYAACSVTVWLLLGVFLLCALYFGYNFGSNFRHVNRLHGAGVAASLVFLLKPVVCLLALFAVLHVGRGDVLGGRARFALFIILVSLVCSITSSLQALTIAVVFLLVFMPKIFTWRLLRCNLKLILMASVLLPLLLFIVLVVGVGNKIGYDVFFSENGVRYVVERGWALFSRVSSSLFSLATVFELILDDQFDRSYSSGAIVFTFLNRVSAVFSSGFDADTIETINRYNYELVFTNLADRAGASPGPLSSMFYFPYFPLGLILIPAIHALMAFNLAKVMGGELGGGIAAMISVPLLMLMFFEAPINIFYIVDPFFFAGVAFFSMRFFPVREFLSR